MENYVLTCYGCNKTRPSIIKVYENKTYEYVLSDITNMSGNPNFSLLNFKYDGFLRYEMLHLMYKPNDGTNNENKETKNDEEDNENKETKNDEEEDNENKETKNDEEDDENNEDYEDEEHYEDENKKIILCKDPKQQPIANIICKEFLCKTAITKINYVKEFLNIISHGENMEYEMDMYEFCPCVQALLIFKVDDIKYYSVSKCLNITRSICGI